METLKLVHKYNGKAGGALDQTTSLTINGPFGLDEVCRLFENFVGCVWQKHLKIMVVGSEEQAEQTCEQVNAIGFCCEEPSEEED